MPGQAPTHVLAARSSLAPATFLIRVIRGQVEVAINSTRQGSEASLRSTFNATPKPAGMSMQPWNHRQVVDLPIGCPLHDPPVVRVQTPIILGKEDSTAMKNRKHTPAQIIRKLAEGEKLLGEGRASTRSPVTWRSLRPRGIGGGTSTAA
jgi:hypothetical protein